MYKIDGKKIAAELREEIRLNTKKIKTTPGLAVILVGANPASQVYVRNKIKACEEAGFESFEFLMKEDVTQAELLDKIDALNEDAAVHGILVQLPLPAHINEAAVINAIAAKKDVDGFHPENIGRMWAGDDALLPCTPKGCIKLLKSVSKDLSGLNAVILGRSNIVGKPMAALLLRENCTVSICHSRTQNLNEITAKADIIIAAIGKPEFVKADMIKEGAIIIDVGINRGADGKLVGDVAYAECSEKASAITPVPGGVGPMTIACLLENTLIAAKS